MVCSRKLFNKFVILRFILGIVIICTVRTDALTFVVEPGNQDVTEGQQAVLPCLVDEKGVTYEWTLDNNNVDTIAGVTIDDGSLIIDSVDKDVHGGEFRCVVSSPNQNQPLVSQPAQLRISCKFLGWVVNIHERVWVLEPTGGLHIC